MSIWHLLWIIPTSEVFGFAVAALLRTAKEADKQREKVGKGGDNH